MGDDLFAFGINYNTVGHSGTPLYNGNIAETEWRTANTDNGLKWYRYAYDPLNRITSATANSSNYSLSGITYDKNGNLQSLTRKGHTNAAATSFGTMDILDYDYHSGEVSNRLYKVNDTGNDTYGFKDSSANNQDYWYDANGNMVRDLNKGIGTTTVDGISYNHLNLPQEIKFDNNNNKKINYIYDALGTKMQKVANDNGSLTTADYAGNYIYENGTLQFFSHPEGYVNANGGGFEYVYQYKDHLGNIRLSYADDPSNPGTPTIIEENNYYPFGLKHKGYNYGGDTALGNDVAQKWKYNGVELEESLGLELYEMPLRNYDPAIGRFTTMDPVVHHSLSPYQGYDNNPIFWADPSGADSQVGADGLTNEQWIALSRPSGGGFDAMRVQARQNFQDEISRNKRATVEVGQGEFQDRLCESCPERMDMNDSETLRERLVLWGRYFKRNPNAEVPITEMLILNENNDEDWLTRTFKKAIGIDEFQNKKTFKIDGSIVKVQIFTQYYSSKGKDGIVNYVSDKEHSYQFINGQRTYLSHISFKGLVGQTRGSGYRHQILVFMFTDSRVRSKIMAEINGEINIPEKILD